MSRFSQWLAISVGVHIAAPISAALGQYPTDWGDAFHASFGAGLALWLFKERDE